MDIKRLINFSALLSLILMMNNVQAHHSALANFDSSRTIIKEGIVEEVKMVNPHASITLRVTTENGEDEMWIVELVSKNALIRLKFDMDRFVVGSNVRLSGWAGKRGLTMYFVLAEFPDGTIIKKQDTFGQPLL
jgi:hypothetical protein